VIRQQWERRKGASTRAYKERARLAKKAAERLELDPIAPDIDGVQ